MKVTVLGSSGQIGAYLVEHLSAKGHDVTPFDIARHHGVTVSLGWPKLKKARLTQVGKPWLDQPGDPALGKDSIA